MPQQPSDGHQCSRLPLSSIRFSTSEDLERPDTGWASHSSCLGTAITYIYASCIYMGYLFFASRADGLALLNSIYRSGIAIPTAIYCFYCVVLCSLTTELAISQDHYWLQRSLQFLIIGVFMTGWIWCTSLFQHLQIFAAIGLYVMGALVHRAIGWSKRSSQERVLCGDDRVNGS